MQNCVLLYYGTHAVCRTNKIHSFCQGRAQAGRVQPRPCNLVLLIRVPRVISCVDSVDQNRQATTTGRGQREAKAKTKASSGCEMGRSRGPG